MLNLDLFLFEFLKNKRKRQNMVKKFHFFKMVKIFLL